MLWRPVLAKMATYREVCDEWNLDELLESIELLDARASEHKRMMAENEAKRLHSQR